MKGFIQSLYIFYVYFSKLNLRMLFIALFNITVLFLYEISIYTNKSQFFIGINVNFR